MNFAKLKNLFANPQGVVSLLAAAVTVLGTTGIVDSGLSGALQTLLAAVLGVVTAAGHATASKKLAARKA